MKGFLKRLTGVGLAAVIALNSGFAVFADTEEIEIAEDVAAAEAGFAFTGYEFDENNTIAFKPELSDGEAGDGEVNFSIPFTGGTPVLVEQEINGAGYTVGTDSVNIWAYLNGGYEFELKVDSVSYFIDFMIDYPMAIGGIESAATDLKLGKLEKEVSVWWETAVKAESADEKIATVEIDTEYNSLIVTPVADGKTTITVTGDNGGKCTVNVTVGADSSSASETLDYFETFYTDSDATKAVEDEVYVYVNGGKNKASGKNYKASTVYTKLENAAVEVKGASKTGKFVTYVTLDENETPKVEGGKVVSDKVKDKEAKNIVSAKIKTDKNTKVSAVTITAGKAAGIAYVWIIDIKADKTAGNMVRIPVQVKAAPKTMLLYKGWTDEGITYDDKGDYASFDTKSAQKTIYIPYGQYYDYRLFAFLNVKGENFAFANDATYSITLSDDAKKYISVDYDGGTSDGCMYLGIEAKGRNAEKPTAPAKVKFDIVCNETGKKLSVAVNIVDNIEWVAFESERFIIPNAVAEKQSVTYAFNDLSEEFEKTDYFKNNTFYSADTNVSNNLGWEQIDGFCSTDKIKLYVTSDTEFSNCGERVAINDWDSFEDFKAEVITKGYTLERSKGKDKFALDKDAKNAYISAKIGKDGSITISAKKGTPDGEQAKLLYVVTHQDKTIDVYEAKITVGAVSPEISIKAQEVYNGLESDFVVKGIYGKEGDVIEITSSDEEIFTFTMNDDESTSETIDARTVVVTGKSEGKAKLIVKFSGITKEYEIEVKPAPTLEVKQQQVTSIGADKVYVGKTISYTVDCSGYSGRIEPFATQMSGYDIADYSFIDGKLTITGVSAGTATIRIYYGVLSKNVTVTVLES